MERVNIISYAVSDCRRSVFKRVHFSFKHLIFLWLTFLALPGVAAADLWLSPRDMS